MASQQKRTFYLYAAGAHLEELTLGSLALNYKNPLLSYRYTHQLLSESDRSLHTRVQNVSSCLLSSNTGRTVRVNLEGAEIANLGINFGADENIIVSGKNGKKIKLKDPDDFLNQQVLTQTPARNNLSLWISAARKRLRKPHIWFLTGMYILDDARTFAATKHEPGLSVGVSQDLIAALTGVPLGGSIDISRTVTLSTTMVMEGSCIWAAQWQRLGIEYFWPWEEVVVPQTIPLYDFSNGDCYSTTDPKAYLPPDRARISIMASSKKKALKKPEEEAVGQSNETSWVESESEFEAEAGDKPAPVKGIHVDARTE